MVIKLRARKRMGLSVGDCTFGFFYISFVNDSDHSRAANVQLVPPTSAPGGSASSNVALVQSDSGNYQLISSDDESATGIPTGNPNAIAANTVNQPLTTNITNLQSLPAGTQLQFQPLGQQTQQQPSVAFSGLKNTQNRNVATSMAAARQGIQQVCHA